VSRHEASRVELLQSTLDLLILRTLLAGPAHGHAIAKHIQRTPGKLLQVETGRLYPALHRLEAKGWIASSWEVSQRQAGQVLSPGAPWA
jgi:PadR family transcriptional regulator, regulatory protein PadR